MVARGKKRYVGKTMLSAPRRLLKRFHPEGIPWPGTVFYNAMSATRIFQHHYELIARDIVSVCPGGRILDIGTGPGGLPVELHRLAPHLRITGLDVSRSMVDKARSNILKAGYAGSIEVMEGDASVLPFGDNEFDAVVSTGSIHHWKEPVACLDEVYRVLRPAGHALVYDLVSDTPKQVLGEAAREFGKFRVLLLWLHNFEEPFLSVHAFERLAAASRFKEGHTSFVGVMCCLILKREPQREPVGV
jgi:ubiquinone/menaquinone biosynthesis C-methylase UbiE